MATNGNGKGIDPRTREALEDATAYPILTESIDTGGTVQTSTLPGGGGSGGAPIGRIVDAAIRDVLAWRPRPGDPKAFVSALTQAFELKDVEGHVEWKWLPRSYAVDADLGAVTGAQASIYARARSFLDQITPLLDGLTPLRPDFDPENIAASRAIVKNGVSELVSELGQEGGPRFARVTQLFSLLLGPAATRPNRPTAATGDNVGGQLGLLKNYFGMDRSLVKNVPEEENYTNFLIIVDGVQGLLYTWNSQRDSFDRKGTNAFLGTQAVLISRQLGVIAETVNDVTVALDSVFLGAAERQVLELPLGGGAPIFLGELLAWINDFATDEGILLVREGGKDGVTTTFLPTVNELYKLARKAASIAYNGLPGPGRRLPDGFRTPRVRRALDDLAAQIGEAVNLADQLRDDRPTVDQIDPNVWEKPLVPDPNAGPLDVTITGTNFRDGSTVRLDRLDRPHESIEAGHVRVRGPDRIDAELKLAEQDAPSEWAVVVTDPDGVDERLRHPFRIIAAQPPAATPTIAYFAPTQGYAGDPSPVISIHGEHLDLVSECSFGTTTMSITSRGVGHLTVVFESGKVPWPASGSAPELQQITLNDGAAQTGKAFTILLPPQVNQVTPEPPKGLMIEGENLEKTAAVALTLTVKQNDQSQSSGQFTSQSVQWVPPDTVNATFQNDFLPSPSNVASVEFVVHTINSDGRRSKGKAGAYEQGHDIAKLFAALRSSAVSAKAAGGPAAQAETSDAAGSAGTGDKPPHGGKGSQGKKS